MLTLKNSKRYLVRGITRCETFLATRIKPCSKYAQNALRTLLPANITKSPRSWDATMQKKLTQKTKYLVHESRKIDVKRPRTWQSKFAKRKFNLNGVSSTKGKSLTATLRRQEYICRKFTLQTQRYVKHLQSKTHQIGIQSYLNAANQLWYIEHPTLQKGARIHRLYSASNAIGNSHAFHA